MEIERVYKGSVAMEWLVEHRDEVCIQGFCSDDIVSEIW